MFIRIAFFILHFIAFHLSLKKWYFQFCLSLHRQYWSLYFVVSVKENNSYFTHLLTSWCRSFNIYTGKRMIRLQARCDNSDSTLCKSLVGETTTVDISFFLFQVVLKGSQLSKKHIFNSWPRQQPGLASPSDLSCEIWHRSENHWQEV